MKYLKYFWYVLRHKWYVMWACFGFGLFWRGLVHDLSKFRPSEFIPYARHFYGGKRDIHEGRDETGYYKPTDTGDPDFDRAWFLHQKRNDHHWQWWVDVSDGRINPLRLSLPAAEEMISDWIGAGRAQGTPDTLAWYRKHKDKLRLHHLSRTIVEALIGYDSQAEEQPEPKQEDASC